MTETFTSPQTGLMSLDIVVPVYNEDGDLEASVRALRSYLDDNFPFRATVTIADNASTDSTWALACRLAAELEGVRVLHTDERGRGRAIRAAWTTSEAEIVAYMDVDLSTGLDALLPLVAPLASGHSDVAIGSRLASGAHVIRGPKRELISRCYNIFLHAVLRSRFTDAQCGFKAIRTSDARLLLPAVEDEKWFFDTEMLVLAERNGLRIHEVPVDWTDDPDSRVQIVETVLADLLGVLRLVRGFATETGRLAAFEGRRDRDRAGAARRFVGIGLLSTLAYLVLFLALRREVNYFVANAISLSVCSVVNLAAHWSYTLRRRRPSKLWPLVAGAVLALCLSVLATSSCLALAFTLVSRSFLATVSALLVGTAVAALGRFLVFQALVFRTELRHRSS